jgi:hypothetical protein
MISKKLQFLMPICIAFMVNAQDVFKVLAAKGGSTVKSANSAEWKKTLIGMKIQQADAIKLNANDYLGLIHIASGKTLELKTAGSYNVKDLATKVSATGSTYSQKYAEYVMNAMNNNSGGTNNSVGGVVYREVLDNKDYSVKLNYPKDQMIMVSSRVFDFSWSKNPKIAIYEVVVQNMFDETIYTAETKDTTVKLDLTKVDFGDESRILVKVRSKKEEEKGASDKAVSILVDESKAFLKKKEAFLSEVSDENALNYLIKAKFYEENKMFIDAVSSYDRAIKLEPKVEEFKSLKNEYLINTGVIKKEENKK